VYFAPLSGTWLYSCVPLAPSCCSHWEAVTVLLQERAVLEAASGFLLAMQPRLHASGEGGCLKLERYRFSIATAARCTTV
jgi:hypothetical protein